MKAYIHDEKTSGIIAKTCEKIGVDILTPKMVKNRRSAPQGIDFFLDEVDFLILEITKPTQVMNFILAQAIIAQKSTLCMYAKNQPPRNILSYIKKRSAPRSVKTFSYTERNLSSTVERFVQLHDPRTQEHDDHPSIKFTLRLTPHIERYLSWYSESHDISKADHIREILTQKAKENDQYLDVFDNDSE